MGARVASHTLLMEELRPIPTVFASTDLHKSQEVYEEKDLNLDHTHHFL